MMNIFTATQTWLLLADILGMFAVILALYLLVLNPRQLVNRAASLSVALLAASILAGSSFLRANTDLETYLPALILVSAIPAIGPSLFLTSIAMVKPAWFAGHRRWILWSLILLILAPGVLTLIDQVLAVQLYVGQEVIRVFTNSFIANIQSVKSLLSQVVIGLDLILTNVLLVILLGYLSLLDKRLAKKPLALARVLLVSMVLAVACIFGAQALTQNAFPILFGSLCLVTHGAASYWYLASSGYVQAGKLQTRLTLLMFIITVPAFIFISSFLTRFAGDQIEQAANRTLQTNADFLVKQVDSWLADNVRMLRDLSGLEDIRSLDAARQKPVLELYAKNHPNYYLISTTDSTGVNIARSDIAPRIDYSDLQWYKNASAGIPITYQTLIGRTTGQPSLVASAPIYGASEEILGVVMSASYLTDLNEQILGVRLGETGYAFLIDEADQLVAHPELKPGAARLVDYSSSPPVQALRSQVEPPYLYTDDKGEVWRAYYTILENGWAIVVQQNESELFQPYRSLQLLSLVLVGAGGIALIGLVWGSLRQAIQPIKALNQTVQSITSGDLDRVASVESDDEVGMLARSFNEMTTQIRTLVGNLEQRVAERTIDLEYRSAQLQAAAEVGHAAASIRNLDELLPHVSRLISERFGFYHVGIFLLDDKGEYALFRATNSPGGQRMLARGHRLKVGQQGIVGFVTARRQPRVALNVGEDAMFFNNPDLPDTQSEMALPLMVGERMLGALDVQSVQPNAFTEGDVETLQVLADQVAIAINSAQLLQQTEELLESERRGFSEASRRAWSGQLSSLKNLGFTRERTGLYPVSSIDDPRITAVLRSGEEVVDTDNPLILYVPVIVRQQVIGILRLDHEQEVGGWTKEEIDAMKSLAEQLGVALESARAYQQTQISAQRDRTLSEIGSRIRETLDISTILRSAALEVRQALDLPTVVIKLGSPPDKIDDELADSSGGSNG